MINILYLQNKKIKSLYNSNIINDLCCTLSNRNKLPYIATYFYNDKFNTPTTLDVEYYVTDYYQLDYMINVKETFVIQINIGQNQTILKAFTINGVQSGDNNYSIDISDLSIGDYWWSIQAIDSKERKSMKVYNEFMVYEEIEINNSNTYTITDDDLTSYSINKNGAYGEYILMDIPSENVDDPYSYLQTYAETQTVDSGKYKCFMADTDGDGYYNFKIQNWFGWREGDYQSYIKYADDYDKEAVEAEALNTTIGLRNLINDKINEGYKKIILPNGYYRTSTQDVIEIVGDNVIVDFNNSTIKSNKLNTPCNDICHLYGYNSHIINGNFEGCVIETDYSEFVTEDDPYAKNWYELGHGIAICSNSRYSSYEDCTVKNITGYGLLSGAPKYVNPPNTLTNWNAYHGYKKLSTQANWVLGNINSQGEYEEAYDRYVYNDFFDISFTDSFPFISINKYLGYQGIHGGGPYFECHMYDENYDYLGYETCMQFRKFWLLPNTRYIKLCCFTNVFERVNASGTSTYPLHELAVVSFVKPINCYMKNIDVENIRCVGATPFGKNCYFDNVNITKSGYAEAHQLLDAEDTWESLQEFVIKNSTFRQGVSSSNLLLVSGINTCIENSDIDFMQYGRARDTVIRNCNCHVLNIDNDGLMLTGYPRIYNNTFNTESITQSFYTNIGSNTYNNNDVDKKIIINNTNTFADGDYGSARNRFILFKDFVFNIPNRGNSPTLLGDYDNCVINNLNGTVANIRATNCVFNDGTFTISNYHNSYYYTSLFYGCTFNNCIITNKTELSDEELFKNCKFN